MNENKELLMLLQSHAAQLGEHFDSVHIFCTKQNGTNATTVNVDTGLGNFYAQLGQVQEWLCIQQQYQKNWAIRRDADSLE